MVSLSADPAKLGHEPPAPDEALDLYPSTKDRGGHYTRYFPNALALSLAEADARTPKGKI